MHPPSALPGWQQPYSTFGTFLVPPAHVAPACSHITKDSEYCTAAFAPPAQYREWVGSTVGLLSPPAHHHLQPTTTPPSWRQSSIAFGALSLRLRLVVAYVHRRGQREELNPLPTHTGSACHQTLSLASVAPSVVTLDLSFVNRGSGELPPPLQRTFTWWCLAWRLSTHFNSSKCLHLVKGLKIVSSPGPHSGFSTRTRRRMAGSPSPQDFPCEGLRTPTWEPQHRSPAHPERSSGGTLATCRLAPGKTRAATGQIFDQ